MVMEIVVTKNAAEDPEVSDPGHSDPEQSDPEESNSENSLGSGSDEESSGSQKQPGQLVDNPNTSGNQRLSVLLFVVMGLIAIVFCGYAIVFRKKRTE